MEPLSELFQDTSLPGQRQLEASSQVNEGSSGGKALGADRTPLSLHNKELLHHTCHHSGVRLCLFFGPLPLWFFLSHSPNATSFLGLGTLLGKLPHGNQTGPLLVNQPDRI
ncbi:hypothetical protein DPEC_G00073040 [Dallia pectoralis]|uniref:Uncharacterized protein n=1 Tax=Dallia pectoralis TaxID=75939 RepID=A0ACC2H2V4_DALPE|nr:hypothetical protein DPEC_G00073040 [Dallia pectoralis]